MATLKSIKNKYLQTSDGDTLGVDDNADNVALLAFKMQATDSIAKFNMIDGFSDAYADATGVDASGSTNETRNDAKYYSGGVTGDATGGTVTTYSSGGNDYKVHSFLADGNLTVPGVGNTDCLVVGCGGKGAGPVDGNHAHGGGGGGGMREISDQELTARTYAIQVGDAQVWESADYHGENSIISTGILSALTVGNGGSGYSTAPTVAIAAPTSGVTATATATVSGGAITGYTITNAGEGYQPGSTPTVTISGGGGNSGTGVPVISGTLIVATGGGAGCSYNQERSSGVSFAGGSGGGGRGNGPGRQAGGPGNLGSFSPSEGNQGGLGSGGGGGPPCPNVSGGGGGGAGGNGGNSSTASTGSATSGGHGGAGKTNAWRTGSDVTYAGGGGGGGYSAGGNAGSGGGGRGQWNGHNNQSEANGDDNTGGGGGGCGHGSVAGVAGSGIVVIRYIEGSFVAYDNMTLVSNSVTAAAQPDTADVVAAYTNGVGTASINTDLKYWVSRDNGTTYTQCTMVSQGTSGGHTLLSARGVDISGQPDGTTMRYKVTTHNQSATKETRAQAVSLAWA